MPHQIDSGTQLPFSLSLGVGVEREAAVAALSAMIVGFAIDVW